ncbi:MAG: class I SAM-dependent methyltransferase [Oscillospiraceae bacterium]|nr:class I SAM-dependent methyltransferase [Oscillospiraceae bacterium]
MNYENFAAYYDALTENVEYPLRAARLHHLVNTYIRTDGRILLDLACGSGSMSEEMAKLGYDVIGVDNSPSMLTAAMDKKYESGLPIQYLCQDMREIDMFGTMDVTICTLDSLNHLPSLEDVKQVFERVSLFAMPGGLFLFDMNTVYKHREILSGQTYIYDTEDVFCAWENHLREGSNIVDMQLTFFEKDGNTYYRSEEQISENAYSVQEITDAVREAGLELLEIFDADADLEHPEKLHAPTETTQRLLFVTKKPELEESK